MPRLTRFNIPDDFVEPTGVPGEFVKPDSNFKQKCTTVQELQAQISLLREALMRAHAIMSWHAARCPMNIPNNYSGSEEHLAEYRKVYQKLIPELLKASPAAAGERVRGLVEALEFYANAENYAHRVDEHAIGWIEPVVFDDTGKRAKDALDKYRGGIANG